MAKPTLTPQEFSAKWASSKLKERAGAQEHFIDVCRLVGHPTPEKEPEELAEEELLGGYWTSTCGEQKTLPEEHSVSESSLCGSLQVPEDRGS